MEGPGPEVQNGRLSPSAAGPFGYSFLSPMDIPFEQAPALPPGPSLLDDNESNMLDNFFTTMTSNNLTNNDFWLRGQQNKSSGFNFDWTEELPPTFEGSSTSLSHPSFQQHGLSKSSLMTGSATSQDLYAAASMLYQGSMNGSHLGPVISHQAFAGQQPLSVNGTHDRRGSQHATPVQGSSSSASRARIPTGFHLSEMLFDVRDPTLADHSYRKGRGLHWGSDGSFMDQGYVAPPDQPDMETRTRELLGHLECFEPQTSTTNTRAPSPERMGTITNQHKSLRGPEPEDDSQPRKRQRTIKDDDQTSEEEEMEQPSRKSRTPNSAKVRNAATNVSRKEKAQPGSKLPRENLSEEQKRTNHILSEQKRRNLIRQGFEDLCSLVPGLRGGGFSKSAMLTQSADWLEDIMQGNEVLRIQLAEMKGNGIAMPR